MKRSDILRIGLLAVLLGSLIWGADPVVPEPIEPLPVHLQGNYIADATFADNDPEKKVPLEAPLLIFSASETGITLADKSVHAFTFLGAKMLREDVYAYKYETGDPTYFVIIVSPSWGNAGVLQERKTEGDELVRVFTIVIEHPIEDFYRGARELANQDVF